MTIERDITKPIFEDWITEENGDWQLWMLAKGDRCGKIFFRLQRGDSPMPGEMYEFGFDAFNQKLIETAGWRRLSAERADLATWFREICVRRFPRCDDCNRAWKEMGCR
jgi:hypothetical protein